MKVQVIMSDPVFDIGALVLVCHRLIARFVGCARWQLLNQLVTFSS